MAVERLSHDNKPPRLTEEEWRNICLDAWRKITPEQTAYDNLEKTAKQILEAAKLPTADSIYSIPDGRPLLPVEWEAYPGRRGTLVSLAEARGFRERIDIEWYAAKILVGHYACRACLNKDPKAPNAAVAIAFELGMLSREMAILVGYIKKNAQKGGLQKKHIPAVFSFVLKSLKAARSLTEPKVWSKIPDDQFEAVKVGKNKLFTERDRLYVLEKKDGKNWALSDRSLSRSSFRKYVKDARKYLAR